jgi:hypothetical protein
MSDSHNKLTDQQIASLLSTQTAIIASLCNLLISKNVVSHTEVVNDLHDLYSLGMSESPAGMAPLMHLLDILENGEPGVRRG